MTYFHHDTRAVRVASMPERSHVTLVDELTTFSLTMFSYFIQPELTLGAMPIIGNKIVTVPENR